MITGVLTYLPRESRMSKHHFYSPPSQALQMYWVYLVDIEANIYRYWGEYILLCDQTETIPDIDGMLFIPRICNLEFFQNGIEKEKAPISISLFRRAFLNGTHSQFVPIGRLPGRPVRKLARLLPSSIPGFYSNSTAQRKAIPCNATVNTFVKNGTYSLFCTQLLDFRTSNGIEKELLTRMSKLTHTLDQKVHFNKPEVTGAF